MGARTETQTCDDVYDVVGMSKWEIDTPALCVDLDAFESNLTRMQQVMDRNGIKSRPHVKTHKCPAIAKRQLESGSIGVCAAKVSEAEVMIAHGIDQVLLTTANVTPFKIQRAMQLRARCAGFVQATDSTENARLLSEAALAARLIAEVVVDLDPGMHRTGVEPGESGIALARLIDSLPGLALRGVLCYDGEVQHAKGFSVRRERSLESLAPAAETVARMREGGLNTEIFSGGGTGTYNIDHETLGLTDVQAGSYIFMDAQYLAIGGESNPEIYSDFEPSLVVLTSVLNDRQAKQATTDAGAKACTINEPWSMVKGEAGMTYRSESDEFGILSYAEDASRKYRVGEKLELIVSHCDPVVNLYDCIYATRRDAVEAVWPIAARGMSR